ncbi:MAG: hypothetical protein ABW252_19500 [Polyangiales bacterium]
MSSYTMTRWISAAALFALGACAATGDAEMGSDDESGETLAQAAPAASGATSGGARKTPVDYADPELKCYRLTAFQSPANKGVKYQAPTTPDFYVNFNIKAPWTGTQYIKSFKSLVDNQKILHHWLLYRQLNGTTEGIVANQTGLHPDGELLYGWAPGTDDLWFDRDVGIEVAGGTVLQLENHYNNRTGGAQPDGSGVEVCVTPKRPTHVAGLSFVGSDAINGVTATGTCTHSSKQPIHLIMSFPHMHTKGTRMKVDWIKKSGQRQTIHDQPFDFDYQRTYVYDDVVLQPGDKLHTTCSYSAPSRLGKGTEDEMCYFFSIHYPNGALSRVSLFTALHGPNTCMD